MKPNPDSSLPVLDLRAPYQPTKMIGFNFLLFLAGYSIAALPACASNLRSVFQERKLTKHELWFKDLSDLQAKARVRL